jgi:hypothetical protein
VSPVLKRRLARKSERGTTVLVVVMVTTLVTAIGVLAVRNASLIDQAVGYSRLSSQTAALAELGTTATVAEFGANKASALVAQMDNAPEKCVSNKDPSSATVNSPCYRLFKQDLEASILAGSSQPLLVSTVTGSETGSFGPTSSSFGDIFVEITEKGPTGRPVAGSDIGGTGMSLKYARVTLTTTGEVRPLAPTGGDDNTCNDGVAAVATKKVMRARVVVGPI